ncbi:histidine kinase [Flavihumibacter sp. CACIAM 22H1]|uniref:sensor histidine kinase n=1 Tax=Flavihumibacter sp. CACIAM 22H1 TaxID=1812911 RepID=UPI0025C04DBC|nr:histidine kinase [Flavihumibacter sp. CACIAM 22H1]
MPEAKKINDIGFRVILIPFCGITIPLLTSLIPFQQFSLLEIKLSFLYTIAIAFIIWEGNRSLLFTLRSYFNWFNQPVKKILALLLVIPFYTIPVSVLLIVGWYQLFLNGQVNWTTIWNNTLIILISVLFIVHVYETVFLVKESESEMLRNATLEKARAEAELQALKNQIDPHFMFNSLNTLSHLIRTNPAKAQVFNDTLAEVYRYILQNKSRDLVLLQEELSFMDNYLALLKIRYGDCIFINKQVSDTCVHTSLLPPISLQILVENAIKHNTFSQKQPLHIHIIESHGQLSVSNQIREKKQAHSNGIGLTNLLERFILITGSQPAIERMNGCFFVHLPLLMLR